MPLSSDLGASPDSSVAWSTPLPRPQGAFRPHPAAGTGLPLRPSERPERAQAASCWGSTRSPHCPCSLSGFDSRFGGDRPKLAACPSEGPSSCVPKCPDGIACGQNQTREIRLLEGIFNGEILPFHHDPSLSSGLRPHSVRGSVRDADGINSTILGRPRSFDRREVTSRARSSSSRRS